MTTPKRVSKHQISTYCRTQACRKAHESTLNSSLHYFIFASYVCVCFVFLKSRVDPEQPLSEAHHERVEAGAGGGARHGGGRLERQRELERYISAKGTIPFCE